MSFSMSNVLDRSVLHGKPHPLAGVIECHCGTNTYVLSGSRKYVVEMLNKIAITDLEAIFHEQLRAFLQPRAGRP